MRFTDCSGVPRVLQLRRIETIFFSISNDIGVLSTYPKALRRPKSERQRSTTDACGC